MIAMFLSIPFQSSSQQPSGRTTDQRSADRYHSQPRAQALLTEVRQLRQGLQISLTRMQSAQILLSRLQIQEVAVSRASQHLDDARSKLAEIQFVVRSETAEIKHYEDAPNTGDNATQNDDSLRRAKSDLEASTSLAQQRQSIETDAELQLRTEQDKLSKLESVLDELVVRIGSEQPAGAPH